MEEVQSSEAPPLFDNIDFNTNDQDYEIFESAVQQVTRTIQCFWSKQSLAIFFSFFQFKFFIKFGTFPYPYLLLL